MGLDQYIKRETYVKNWGWGDKNHWEVLVTKNNNPSHIKKDNICYITEEVAYFRKFNALHNWFVQNLADGVDECQRISFYKENVENLLRKMKNVLESKDEDFALEEFPPVSGFFFGSTEIGEWYWKDLKEAIKVFTEMYDEWEETAHYYYQSSW